MSLTAAVIASDSNATTLLLKFACYIGDTNIDRAAKRYLENVLGLRQRLPVIETAITSHRFKTRDVRNRSVLFIYKTQ